MQLHFGLDFDSPIARPQGSAADTDLWLGPRGLLRWLECQTGLGGCPENTDYLRIELYRQALLEALEQSQTPVFYAASFQADRFACATVLLEYRDQLLLGGWDFAPQSSLQGRLPLFARIEQLYQAKRIEPQIARQSIGEADRWMLVLQHLQRCRSDAFPALICLYEQPEHLPAHIKTWLHTCAEHSQIIQAASLQTGRIVEEIIILRARRDTDLAVFLAQLCASNPHWKPTLLLPDMNRCLEQAMLQEGLPALGVPSASLGRPALQVLKLAPAFLWEPVDIPKIMEFVTLSTKPLERGLALEIARVLSEKPGLFSERWFGAVLGYLQKEDLDPEVREQYEFWFQRKRYASDQTLPKKEAIGLYTHLQHWARNYFERSSNKDNSMLALAEQARRISELLDFLPEQQIGFLELERIVRTIYEPSPAHFAETETGAFHFVHQPGALAAPIEELVWWDCIYHNEHAGFDFWYAGERSCLRELGCAPDDPQTLSERKHQVRRHPLFVCQKRLWICLPEQSNGTENVPNLILGDLLARKKELKLYDWHIDKAEDRAQIQAWLAMPERLALPTRDAREPRPVIQVPPVATDSLVESPTNLEALFFYPHRWYLRQQAGIYPSNLFSLKKDGTMQGNLAHRFFELLLPLSWGDWSKDTLNEWVSHTAPDLLEKEGATLLLYGREPERKAFLQKIKNAAWSLLSLLKNNGWEVAQTEHPLRGRFGGIEVHGKADLILRRADEQAIIDLKWGGNVYRKELIQNEEDLQLVLYAQLLRAADGPWPHTAYFIIENGRMIARNNAAFKEAQLAGKQAFEHQEVAARILQRMEKTFEWRCAQMQAGQLELRSEHTAETLESLYADVLMDLLEMKKGAAKWDDYRTLLEFG